MRHFEHDERDKDLIEIGFDMLSSKLYKIIMNKVTFVGFTGVRSPQSPPGSATATLGWVFFISTLLLDLNIGA